MKSYHSSHYSSSSYLQHHLIASKWQYQLLSLEWMNLFRLITLNRQLNFQLNLLSLVMLRNMCLVLSYGCLIIIILMLILLMIIIELAISSCWYISSSSWTTSVLAQLKQPINLFIKFNHICGHQMWEMVALDGTTWHHDLHLNLYMCFALMLDAPLDAWCTCLSRVIQVTNIWL